MAGRPPKKAKNDIAESVKARAFTFLIYPESWKSWEDDLRSLHMPIVVSPLHDRDVWTVEDERNNDEHIAGERKKQHRHAIISWENPTTIRNALATLKPFGISYVEPVASYPTYCRYFCHLDNPDKAQYDVADVVCLGGAVPDMERKLTDAECRELRKEILRAVRENGVIEYSALVDYATDHRPDWCEDVFKHTIFWRGYLESRRHSAG